MRAAARPRPCRPRAPAGLPLPPDEQPIRTKLDARQLRLIRGEACSRLLEELLAGLASVLGSCRGESPAGQELVAELRARGRPSRSAQAPNICHEARPLERHHRRLAPARRWRLERRRRDATATSRGLLDRAALPAARSAAALGHQMLLLRLAGRIRRAAREKESGADHSIGMMNDSALMRLRQIVVWLSPVVFISPCSDPRSCSASYSGPCISRASCGSRGSRRRPASAGEHLRRDGGGARPPSSRPAGASAL